MQRVVQCADLAKTKPLLQVQNKQLFSETCTSLKIFKQVHTIISSRNKGSACSMRKGKLSCSAANFAVIITYKPTNSSYLWIIKSTNLHILNVQFKQVQYTVGVAWCWCQTLFKQVSDNLCESRIPKVVSSRH